MPLTRVRGGFEECGPFLRTVSAQYLSVVRRWSRSYYLPVAVIAVIGAVVAGSWVFFGVLIVLLVAAGAGGHAVASHVSKGKTPSPQVPGAIPRPGSERRTPGQS
jgi:uncharacterized membrane protein YdbT with pleckstrin-like domain